MVVVVVGGVSARFLAISHGSDVHPKPSPKPSPNVSAIAPRPRTVANGCGRLRQRVANKAPRVK